MLTMRLLLAVDPGRPNHGCVSKWIPGGDHRTGCGPESRVQSDWQRPACRAEVGREDLRQESGVCSREGGSTRLATRNNRSVSVTSRMATCSPELLAHLLICCGGVLFAPSVSEALSLVWFIAQIGPMRPAAEKNRWGRSGWPVRRLSRGVSACTAAIVTPSLSSGTAAQRVSDHHDAARVAWHCVLAPPCRSGVAEDGHIADRCRVTKAGHDRCRQGRLRSGEHFGGIGRRLAPAHGMAD